MRSALPFSILVTLSACVPSESGPPATTPQPAVQAAGETASFTAAGPQSYTPETKPKGRERAVRQLWSAPIGRTDHRTTLSFADGAVWIGTGGGPHGRAGVYAIDGKTGARRTFLPASSGDVIGVAIDGDHVFASSSTGVVSVSTKNGKPVLRVALGAPIVTPPTLLRTSDGGALGVAVGDVRGKVTVLDGGSGEVRWSRALAAATEPRPAIGAGLAAADLDGDGAPELVAGTGDGRLFALRGSTGETVWQVARPSPLRAAPLVCDVNADREREVIVGWADGDVAILDGKDGKEIWKARVEEDNGDPTGLLASPTPLPGGSLLVPTSRWGKEDSAVLLRAHDRAYRSRQGSIVGSPVLGTIQPGTNMVEALVGTTFGDVVSFDAAGGMTLVYHLDDAIDASPLIADIEGNGLQELVVATRSGRLVALAIHATVPPLLGRAAGTSLGNDRLLAPIDLGWRLP